MAREAKAAHGLDNGVEKGEKTEEDEVQIISLKQQALAATRTGFQLGRAGLNLGKTSAKLVEKFPTGGLSLVDVLFGAAHKRSESAGSGSYE